MKQLTDTIQSHIEAAGGTWGVALNDLNKEQAWQYNKDTGFNAASVIKLPIMVAAYQAFENGQFTFSDSMELQKEEQVGGSGVLQHMTPGTELTVYDIMKLMIIQSDNTATNMMIDLLGVEQIQRTMEEAGGLKNSTITNKLMIVSRSRTGPNQVTANDMMELLTNITRGEIISEYACRQMIAILKKQQINDYLPGKLPDPESWFIGVHPTWSLAHKTGSVTNVTHDVGIFYVGERAFIAAVLSMGISNFEAQQTMMEIGEAIYMYLFMS